MVSGFNYFVGRPARIPALALRERQLVYKGVVTLPEFMDDYLPIEIKDPVTLPTAYLKNVMHRCYVADVADDGKCSFSMWFEGAAANGTLENGKLNPPPAESGHVDDGGDWYIIESGAVNSATGAPEVRYLEDTDFNHVDFLSGRFRVEDGVWSDEIRLVYEIYADALTWLQRDNTYIPEKSEKSTRYGDVTRDLTTERES